jgi:DNA polymerase-3 subunit epsilon
MHLNLTKPLAFFDLETTGVNISTDRIVEISVVRVNTDNTTDILTKKINPTIPIPLVTSKIHGIYDKDVADAPTFKEVSAQLFQFISNCDLGGFNSNKFDVPLLAEEFLRAEIDFDLKNRKLIDVQNIFHIMEPRNLTAAYKFYCGKHLENAHSAEADTVATYEIFKAQIQHYENTEKVDEQGNAFKPVVNDMSILSELTNRFRQADLSARIVYNEKDEEIFNFGKHKGKTVKEVFEKEPGYYSWMMQGDFPLYTKKIITQIRLSMK